MEIQPQLAAELRPFAGPAIKYISAVDRPFWQDSDLGPNALTSSAIGETWDASDGQRLTPQDAGAFTVFSGGAAAQQCLQIPKRQRDAQMTTWINAIYPHYGSAVRKRLFMAWPEERWTACGYSCPSLGEVTSIYPRLEEGIQDKLFFAGEYASLLFTGYMEGALHSGAVLAGRIAKRLNLA